MGDTHNVIQRAMPLPESEPVGLRRAISGNAEACRRVPGGAGPAAWRQCWRRWRHMLRRRAPDRERSVRNWNWSESRASDAVRSHEARLRSMVEPVRNATPGTGRDTVHGRWRLVQPPGRRRGSRWPPASPCSPFRRARPSCDRASPGPRVPAHQRRGDDVDDVVHGGANTPAPYRALSPSRSSTASFSPVQAPEGTDAVPVTPLSRWTYTRMVGCPGNRESRERRWSG
jgi:hypothetical protein